MMRLKIAHLLEAQEFRQPAEAVDGLVVGSLITESKLAGPVVAVLNNSKPDITLSNACSRV